MSWSCLIVQLTLKYLTIFFHLGKDDCRYLTFSANWIKRTNEPGKIYVNPRISWNYNFCFRVRILLEWAVSLCFRVNGTILAAKKRPELISMETSNASVVRLTVPGVKQRTPVLFYEKQKYAIANAEWVSYLFEICWNAFLVQDTW